MISSCTIHLPVFCVARTYHDYITEIYLFKLFEGYATGTVEDSEDNYLLTDSPRGKTQPQPGTVLKVIRSRTYADLYFNSRAEQPDLPGGRSSGYRSLTWSRVIRQEKLVSIP